MNDQKSGKSKNPDCGRPRRFRIFGVLLFTFHHELFTFIKTFKCTNMFSCKCTKLWILSPGKYFRYKNHLDLRLQIWAFLKIDQFYLQICLNIFYVSFHWSSKNVTAFIHVFEVSWKEPKIFTILFKSNGHRLPIYGINNCETVFRKHVHLTNGLSP